MTKVKYTWKNMDPNYIKLLFIEYINIMQTNTWNWPSTWGTKEKNNFLAESLEYAEQMEFYEQCAIIRDTQETIND